LDVSRGDAVAPDASGSHASAFGPEKFMHAATVAIVLFLSLVTAPLRAMASSSTRTHYSHDAWRICPPKDAIAILRKAGLSRTRVELR
jgi:hypothetical protein